MKAEEGRKCTRLEGEGFAILHTNLFSTDLRLEKKVMIDLRIDYLMSG